MIQIKRVREEDSNRCRSVEEQFTHNKDLLELLAVCSIEHENTFASILAATQKRWLIAHPHLQEEGSTYPLSEQTRIKELAKKLGYITEVFPIKTYYDYAVILGGETRTMEPRFAFMDKLWQSGIHFGSLVFHSGVHMMPEYDYYKNYTESEALRILCTKAKLAEKFAGIPHVFVDIPLVKKDHEMRNPTTADGVLNWLSLQPKPGTCLVISSQPYINYQHAVFCAYMPSGFSIETVGSAVANTIQVSDILDSITRHMYQVSLNFDHDNA